MENMIALQAQMKQQAEETADALASVREWMSSIGAKDSALRGSQQTSTASTTTTTTTNTTTPSRNTDGSEGSSKKVSTLHTREVHRYCNTWVQHWLCFQLQRIEVLIICSTIC